MIKLTVQEALDIQARHVEHYGPRYPGGTEALRRRVEADTKSHKLAPGVEYPVSIINQHIPRGAAIEAML